MSKLSDLVALCQGHTVYIQTHNFPDPDAIASVFGLQKLLELYGVESVLCYDGKIDKLSASKMRPAFWTHFRSRCFHMSAWYQICSKQTGSSAWIRRSTRET